MVIRGRVHNGVVVFPEGVRLPEGSAVCIVPEGTMAAVSQRTAAGQLSEEEHRKRLDILAEIAALPIEGSSEPFSGADHDRVLYGRP
jgi:hypothetical protein